MTSPSTGAYSSSLARYSATNIQSLRKTIDASQWGVAAPAKSETFRILDHSHKPAAQRWDAYLSKESASRYKSSLKSALGFLHLPGMVSLGGGVPSSEYFPWDELQFKVPASAGQFSEKATHEHGVLLRTGKHDQDTGESVFDIATAANYGQGHGSAQLLRWITEHTELVHNPPYSDWACTMTLGSTSGFEFAIRMLAEPGDYIVSEEYTFSTAIECATPIGVRFAGVQIDHEGLLPDSLNDVLTKWEPSERDGARKPTVLYTVPTGQNPTGATQSAQRRKDIYAVAQKHNLLILEDDPYFFLQMQPSTGEDASATHAPAAHAEFLQSLTPSYLSIDVDGRVMRMDSFSKVLAPGSRCGWITASAQIAERYSRHSEVGTQGPSGLSQLMLFKLLDEHWGHGGFLDWLLHIRVSYSQRRDVILEACERWLPKEVVSWTPPVAGMFFWLQIDWKKHPHSSSKSIAEIEQEIFSASIDHRALLIKGSNFLANKNEEHDSLFFRATYSFASPDKIHEAIRRFGDAVRESFGLEA